MPAIAFELQPGQISDLVKSQFSLRRDRTWPAHVNEVYGALALVDFDDDHALHWVECDRMWKR